MSKQRVAALRVKAAKYRALGLQTNDGETAAEILTLAAETEQQARDLEQSE
jgi:hypothetical protein